MNNQHPHAANTATTACPACLKEGGLSLERARQGFSREDVWSFDLYLAKVIAGGCRTLVEEMNGCPPELCENADDVDVGCEKWKQILLEIAAGFQKWADEDEIDRVTPSPEFNRAFDLLRKWWPNLWD